MRSKEFKHSEAFKKSLRVWRTAGRFLGMTSKKAVQFADRETCRLFPEEHSAQIRHWRRANPERSTQIQNKAQKGHRARLAVADTGAVRRAARERITATALRARKAGHAPLLASPDEVVAVLQTTACMVCGRSFKTARSQHVDHCHKSGRLRGVLCRGCNSAEGLLRSDPAIVRSLLAYLEKHQPKEPEA